MKIFFVLFLQTFIIAQNLPEELSNKISGKADTVKIQLLSQYAHDNSIVNPQVALEAGVKAEKLARLIKDYKRLSNLLIINGNIYKNISSTNKAFENFQEAEMLARQLNDTVMIARSLYNLGIIHAMLDKFKSADSNFNEAKKLVESKNEIKMKLEYYNFLARYYEIKKDYLMAYGALKQYDLVKDTLSKIETKERLAEIEKVYNWEKGEKENILLHKDLELREKQNTYLIIIVLLFIVLTVVGYSRYRVKKIDTEQLKKVNIMKDTLLRIIAHDLKTPFTVIFGYTEVLKEDFKNISDDEKLMYLESIRKASRLSIQLLENLTMWFKSHEGSIEFKPTIINLSEVIRENIYILEPSAETKNIKLISDVDESLAVYADENMLKTILRNLISNGIKFTKENGYVKIYSEDLRDKIKITVEDNGVGMDEATLSTLFNADELISSEGTAGERGSGFGLLLCKEFVSKNKGEIWVESNLNKGSKFIFTLPTSSNI